MVLFFCAFGLPEIGINRSFWFFGVTGLVLYTSAFVCEAVRSGINSVSPGQAEAARAIGLTFTQSLGQVVLPQALRTVVPPLGSVIIAMFKNSAVVGAFGVGGDLFSAGRPHQQRPGLRDAADLPRGADRVPVHHAAGCRGARPDREEGGDRAMTSVLYDAQGPRARRLTLIGTVIGVVVVLAVVAVVVLRLADRGQFDAELWAPLLNPGDETFPSVWRLFGSGLLYTLQAAAIAMVLSLGSAR